MLRSSTGRASGVLAVFVSFLMSSVVVRADTINLSAVKDNTLYESSAGNISNGAGAHFFSGRTGIGLIRRGLIAFDIAGNIPNASAINSVTLRLYMSKTNLTLGGSAIVSLHPVLADWGEGASNATLQEGSGAPAAAGDATWLHTFFSGSFWTSTGGDFNTSSSATQTVTGIGYYSWSSAGMVTDVQTWLDDPGTNFGWLLLGNELKDFRSKRFDTKENSNAALRPVLTVEYEPSIPTEQNTWGAIKALYGKPE